MLDLKENHSIVIVTNNMQQAARRAVEDAPTDEIFTNPDDKRTEDYVTGKVG